MSKYAYIIARLEKATAWDENIDAAIAEAVGELPEAPVGGKVILVGGSRFDVIDEHGDAISVHDPIPYTLYIDTAIALVERMLPGAKVGLYLNTLTSHPKEEGARAFVRRDKGKKCQHTGIRWPKIIGDCFYSPTAPLAILLALFRALDAQETSK